MPAAIPPCARILLPSLLALVVAFASMGAPAPAAHVQRPGEAPAAAPSRPGSAFPWVVFDPARIDLGRLRVDEGRMVDLTWHRAGPGTVRVLAVRSDCGCAALDALPDSLAEGSGGTLRLRFLGRRTTGPFVQRVRVYAAPSAGVERPIGSVLEIRGCVEREVAIRPTRVDLGHRTPASTSSRTVEILTTAGTAHVRPEAWLDGLEGGVRVEAHPIRGQSAPWIARLRIEAPRAPGPFGGTLWVRVGRLALLRIPVAGRVVAALKARQTGAAATR